ncbi:MAG TPA: TldD/PmbA family protein [Candidatus Lustribacter sp.]|jgi:TldD protein|nr:TldD/PmbA family protein [Candidatus Lustribacter sp.]
MEFSVHAERALDTALARGAAYADVRFERTRTERIEVRNGDVAALSDTRSEGFGLRALVDGAWGFAACARFDDASLDAAAARAVAMARAGAAAGIRRIGTIPSDAYVDHYVTPLERDPAGVPLGERVALLLDAERALHSAPSIAVGLAWLDLWRTEKEFYSSIGSRIAQTIYQSGSAISALAVGDGDAQIRMWPGDRGMYFGGGWEVIELAELRENAARIGEEAHQLLAAPQCPSGTMDVILGGSQMSLQIHESCGHAAELDRIMGWEANFSGTSFLDPAERGRLRYGSPIVTIEIDNTMPRGFATCGYDDEGTKCVRADIIRDGMLVGFESSRDTAAQIGSASTSCVRAESWEYVPMIRMCNLNLLPGDVPFEHLFDDVREGVYMEANRSWSIDDRRLNFQFGTQIGWEIKHGKRGRMLKNPTYGGVTPVFWNSCDAIADAASWFEWGTPNCGKGEPMQTGRTTQAAAPARFRNVAVGVGYGR